MLNLPIAHGEGNYFADEQTLAALESSRRIIFRYCDAAGQVTDAANPNGSLRNIAGICSEGRNVVGLMPHPERAFRTVQNSWAPSQWGENAPTYRLFANARAWVG